MATEQTTDLEVPAYIETSPWKGKRRAYVSCPYCGDAHVHGASDGDGNLVLGSRASHCLTGKGGGYHLVKGPEGMEKPKELTTRERRRMLAEDDQRRRVPLREAVVGW